jgi:hypothetical protein
VHQATIGVDFALKVLPWDDHTTIRLQVSKYKKSVADC